VIIRIRELSRSEGVGADLRPTVNQLYQVLLRYYPRLLQLSKFLGQTGLILTPRLLRAAPVTGPPLRPKQTKDTAKKE